MFDIISSTRFRRKLLLSAASIVLGASVVHADVSPEDMADKGYCSGTDAAGCWQQAILHARNAASGQSGVVVGTAGTLYRINRQIVICNGRDGVIDGRGAKLLWTGSASEPMFLVVGSNHMRFANLSIESSPETPLQSAFEFASTDTTDNNPSKTNPFASPICEGPPVPSSKNSLDHVLVQGTRLGGLQYGVRFSNRYLINNNDGINNDMSTIIDTTFNNVSTAAISIEHSQSDQHRFIAVNGYGPYDASGNPTSTENCFVSSPYGGNFTSVGGFQGFWGKANFCLGASGLYDIEQPNSESSRRMLIVGLPGDTPGFGTNGVPVTVNINGGRFAVNKLDEDGRYISFHHVGSLSVRGLQVDGSPPTAVAARERVAIAVQPGVARVGTSTSPTVAATTSVIVEGVTYYLTSGTGQWPTDTWTTLLYKGPTTVGGAVVEPVKVREFGNLCVNGNPSNSPNGSGRAVPCKPAQQTSTNE